MSNFLWVIIVLAFVYSLLMRGKKETPVQTPVSFLLRKALQWNILSSEQVNALFQAEESELIEKWLQKKLITPEQAALLKAEKAAPSPFLMVKSAVSKNMQSGAPIDTHRLIMGMSAFAAGCVVLGIIALIAANWDIIPALAKLLCFFGLFLGNFFVLCYAHQKQKSVLSEICLGLSIGLVGAGIGLIGQIYHLSGSFGNAFFLWIILSTPYFLLSHFQKAPVLWSVLYGIGAVWSTGSETAVLWILAVLPIVLTYQREKEMPIIWWVSFVSVCVKADWFQEIMRWLSLNVMPLPTLFFVGGILLFFWMLCHRFLSKEAAFTDSFKYVLPLYFGIGFFGIDLLYTQKEVYFTLEKGLISICFALSGIVLPLLFVANARQNNQQQLFYFLYIGLGVSLLYAFMAFSFAGVLLTVFVLMMGCIYAVQQNKIPLFNWCLGLMFLRILWTYIDLFMSLMSTGISLILLGVTVWAGLLFWIKGRHKLIAFIQRSLPHA